MENSRNERLISFQLCTVLSGLMKPRAGLCVLPRALSRVSPPVSSFTAFSVIGSTARYRRACAHMLLISLNSAAFA